MIIPSITKLGASIIFPFLVFRDCVINNLFNAEEDILIICGGDSQLLTKSLTTQKENIINAPNLVMEGMIIHYLSIKKLA